MTPSKPETATPDLAAIWASARQLYPIYAELAREFVIDLPVCAELEQGAESPASESVEQAQQWLHQMDERIQVHQLRQFLQTTSLVDPEGIVALIKHLLGNPAHGDAMRDKIDFLLVQYFSQVAPDELDDNAADLTCVAHALEPIVGALDLKPPVWLKSLDRVLDAARKCRSLDELLHGGVLEQGRKAKGQAGDLFYLPVALVAFTRFGYLMRRVFFRLMLADLNNILDGLTELEEKGVETLDCRRAQFSAQEPVVRLRMICQSWKVMFQAEYSSGQPLRMLVDLRASVEGALGRGTSVAKQAKSAVAAPAKAAVAAPAKTPVATAAKVVRSAAAAAAAKGPSTKSATAASRTGTAKSEATVEKADSVEFEISGDSN
jgi:hypothetical protein